MISNISAKVAKWLLKSGAISENDVELYEYAVYSFFFGLVPFAMALLIGACMGQIADGLLMLIPFMLIRKFSGGFHLQSSSVCVVSSMLLISLFMLVIRIVDTEIRIAVFSAFVLLATVQIFACSPIDNDARKLNSKEYAAFKKVARIMAAAFVAVYFALLALGYAAFSTPVGAGILLTALLQIPCFFTAKHKST